MINFSDNARAKVWNIVSGEDVKGVMNRLPGVPGVGNMVMPHLRKANQSYEKSSDNWTAEVESKERTVYLFGRQCRSQ